jgi:hypothetical protein
MGKRRTIYGSKIKQTRKNPRRKSEQIKKESKETSNCHKYNQTHSLGNPNL